MHVAFPGESAEYRAARDLLLGQEIELRRAMEDVAAARRALPPGGVVTEDYVFQGKGADGAASDVRLPELFAPGKDSLAIYSFMFPRDPGDDRPLLGLGALLRARRPRPRPAPRRHSRAGLEPVRPHAGRAPGRLGRATALRVTDPVADRGCGRLRQCGLTVP